MNRQALINKAKRIVIKIGSSLITRNGKGLAQTEIAAWAQQMAELQTQGREVVLVSSGAVAEGMARLGWKKRPQALHELQAAAAIGQMGLVQSYETCFKTFDIKTAQILLTHDDLENRRRYLNARSTLKSLLDLGVIPIVNENDSVAMDEIRFGDNDSLASMVANLIEADLLIILTDQDGLFTANPQLDQSATLISEADVDDAKLLEMAGPGASDIGRGGMITKIQAARRAAKSGTHSLIASGRTDDSLQKLFTESHGTFLKAGQGILAARKRWLADNMQPKGSLVLDAGAVKVLKQSGSSLLPIGVVAVKGSFKRGDLVSCLDENRQEIARGLVNYNHDEAQNIKGQSSQKIREILGYVDEPELIHRDNLVII